MIKIQQQGKEIKKSRIHFCRNVAGLRHKLVQSTKFPSWKKEGWSCSSVTVWFSNLLPTQKISTSICSVQTKENYTSTKDSEQCYFLAPFPCECALKSGIQLSLFRWIYLQSLVCNLIRLKLKQGIKIRPIKNMCHLDYTIL